MTYNLDVVRAVLRSFAAAASAGADEVTDAVSLAAPAAESHDDALGAVRNRLVEVGLLQGPDDVRMTRQTDPVALRPTAEGGVWVRRAGSDEDWQASLPELRRLLSPGDAPIGGDLSVPLDPESGRQRASQLNDPTTME